MKKSGNQTQQPTAWDVATLRVGSLAGIETLASSPRSRPAMSPYGLGFSADKTGTARPRAGLAEPMRQSFQGFDAVGNAGLGGAQRAAIAFPDQRRWTELLSAACRKSPNGLVRAADTASVARQAARVREQMDLILNP